MAWPSDLLRRPTSRHPGAKRHGWTSRPRPSILCTGLGKLAALAGSAWQQTQALMQKDEPYAAAGFASRSVGYQARELKRVLSTVRPTPDGQSFEGSVYGAGLSHGSVMTEADRQRISGQRLMAAKLGFCVTQTHATPAKFGSNITFEFRPYRPDELPDLTLRNGSFESEGKSIPRDAAQLLASAHYWSQLPPGHLNDVLRAPSLVEPGAPTSPGLSRFVEDLDVQAVTGTILVTTTGAGFDAMHVLAGKRQMAELLGYEIDTASRWKRTGSGNEYRLAVGGVDVEVAGPERLQAFETHRDNGTRLTLDDARSL
jgi:hypothetical protein